MPWLSIIQHRGRGMYRSLRDISTSVLDTIGHVRIHNMSNASWIGCKADFEEVCQPTPATLKSRNSLQPGNRLRFVLYDIIAKYTSALNISPTYDNFGSKFMQIWMDSWQQGQREWKGFLHVDSLIHPVQNTWPHPNIHQYFLASSQPWQRRYVKSFHSSAARCKLLIFSLFCWFENASFSWRRSFSSFEIVSSCRRRSFSSIETASSFWRWLLRSFAIMSSSRNVLISSVRAWSRRRTFWENSSFWLPLANF